MSPIIPEDEWRVISKLKRGHESHQYSFICNDSDVDRKQRLRAIDRHQNHGELTHNGATQGTVLF